MSTIETPFAIGQEMWLPLHTPHQEIVPCPICKGQKAVTLILGDGEELGVECDACGRGYEGPKGYVTEWDWTPGAVRFVIASVESFSGDVWYVRSKDERRAAFTDLYKTEVEAFAASTTTARAQQERNQETRRQKRKGASGLAWSAQYHRSCIADLERQLAWHRAKLAAPPTVGRARKANRAGSPQGDSIP